MITRDKFDRQVRAQLTEFQTREEADQAPHITGYFSVFGGVYEIGPGMTESVDRHAFDKTLGGDIRALTNHDTTLVLGRTTAHTLELRVDEHGLWGDVTINPNDHDAMNLYERVKRGDVDQCSFGFNIVSEETEFRDDGSIHWTITEVELHEVSVCTFPAYEDTNVSARQAQREELSKNRLQDWKESMRARINKEDKINA
jgi:HK97 family phage prohead protease